MENTEDYQKDIHSIRQLMERSAQFISLSGLSGILSGLYALAGAALAWLVLQSSSSHPLSTDYRTPLTDYRPDYPSILAQLLGIAAAVLIASLITGFVLSSNKARKSGAKLWDSTTRRLMVNLAIPLVAGGLFILILLLQGHFALIAPSCLIFYGLALINASPNLYEEVRYLGYTEILLGLLCGLISGYGLFFWAAGFGVGHILYGAIMYRKYDA